MSDDDYFDDFFLLDAQALAALDQAENQYVATQRASSRPPPAPPPRLPPPAPAQPAPPPRPLAQATALARPPPNAGQPPAKRQKVASGWAAPVQPRSVARVPSLDDVDMPEIRVDGGFYGAPDSQSNMLSSQMSQGGSSILEAPSFAAVHTSTPSSVAHPGGRAFQPSQPVVGPSLHRQPTVQNSISNPRTQQTSYNGSSQQQRRGASPAPGGGRTLARSRSHPSPLGSQPSQRSGSLRESILQTIRASQALRPVEEDLNVAELKRQLEQLQRENQEAKAKLDAAVNEKRAKAGEVAILRQNLDKATEAHHAELSALRNSRNSLEAQHAESARAHAEEIERMRTQLVFKTNELNSTSRRPGKPAPQPAPASSQMPGWNSSIPGPALRRSPRKLSPGVQFPVPPHGSPRRSRTQAPPASQRLPGFVNAFLPATQAPTTPRMDKGNARAEPTPSTSAPWPADDAEEAAFFGSGSGAIVQDTWEQQPQWSQLQAPSPPISPRRTRRVGVEMDVDPPTPVRTHHAEKGKEDCITPPDWASRLHQILFMHVFEPTRVNAFQMILGATVPAADAGAYASACRMANATLGIANQATPFDTVADTLSSVFARMARILVNGELLLVLSALCNLVAVLALALPSFSHALVVYDESSQQRSFLLQLARAITRLLPNNEEGERELLAKETLRTLDLLIWLAPRECDVHLGELPRQNKNLLVALLAEEHSTWFLKMSMRCITSLASRAPQNILTLPYNPNDLARPDYTKLPQLERVCGILRDPERTDAYLDVLSLLVALAIAPGESLPILCESRAVFATLVMYLHELCTPIWEEDDALLGDAAAIDKTVHLVMLITLLLHKLATRLSSDLKAKLAAYRQMTTGQYIGVGHMFSVTLTRLSYGEVPEEIEGANQRRMADVGEVAETILELVIDGPEAELAYSTYVDDGEPQAQPADVTEIEDEADMEASMLG